MQNQEEKEVIYKPYEYEITVHAESEYEAEQVMEAITKFMDRLHNEELIATVEFMEAKPKALDTIREWIQKPPFWIEFIKRYLPAWMTE